MVLECIRTEIEGRLYSDPWTLREIVPFQSYDRRVINFVEVVTS